MVSRKENKAAALHEKLQQLRSITNSRALSNTSIILDASIYIEDLKQRVETLTQEIASSQNSSYNNPHPTVKVESLEKGFLINVISKRNCPGLLVSILESFDELGLNVVETNFSGTESFHLQAVGGDVILAATHATQEEIILLSIEKSWAASCAVKTFLMSIDFCRGKLPREHVPNHNIKSIIAAYILKINEITLQPKLSQ